MRVLTLRAWVPSSRVILLVEREVRERSGLRDLGNVSLGRRGKVGLGSGYLECLDSGLVVQ